MGLTITPLLVGAMPDEPIPGTCTDLTFLMYVITGGPHPIVVDTATYDAATVLHRRHGVLVRPPSQEPAAALAAAGVDPSDVRQVVLTHLHWDHCGNNGLFPNAEFVVQREELRYAVAPAESGDDLLFYDLLGLGAPPWLAQIERLARVDGDAAIAAGVRAVLLPGHTPGSQGVVVDTARGPALIAGDTVPTYHHWRERIPNAVYFDLAAYERTFRRMEALDCHVIPSHDPEVIAQGPFG
ncbi:N-acyl homoserine lactonase family protein [Dactylosporangium darangshiense]|uniref:N-acyl homoserine lactonase family protein n=1 Tax=Dactylosporangium darangshiense TaxID=579108 RepID=A0ABP8DD40_9ACTN